MWTAFKRSTPGLMLYRLSRRGGGANPLGRAADAVRAVEFRIKRNSKKIRQHNARQDAVLSAFEAGIIAGSGKGDRP